MIQRGNDTALRGLCDLHFPIVQNRIKDVIFIGHVFLARY
ncbi:hypothetical protein PAMC26510_36495 [Caballeronia sordidicola]|uniref:Uncharacterized protein n=1 Tax=Caballeronia sordidicola TaxID=196367 RepID=A0A242M494_CABSO|nr:hypothetical protein PAMC26510_36495 [Caballeronia sordidicola]